MGFFFLSCVFKVVVLVRKVMLGNKVVWFVFFRKGSFFLERGFMVKFCNRFCLLCFKEDVGRGLEKRGIEIVLYCFVDKVFFIGIRKVLYIIFIN